jgi:hypothetical protein
MNWTGGLGVGAVARMEAVPLFVLMAARLRLIAKPVLPVPLFHNFIGEYLDKNLLIDVDV